MNPPQLKNSRISYWKTTQTKNDLQLKKYRAILFVFILVLTSCLSVLFFQIENKKRDAKEDLIELSNIKYGLFNVDQWKDIISIIVIKKIEEFELDRSNRGQMKMKVSKFLYKIIGDLEKRYYEQNSGSVSGFFKSGVASLTGTFEKIKQDIPIFSKQIVGFVDDPKNKKAMKSYIISKLSEYRNQTFATFDYRLRDSVLKKYRARKQSETIAELRLKVDGLEQTSNNFKYALFLIAILSAISIILFKHLNQLEFILLTIICFLFLVLGLSLPMIEIDARVTEMNLSLMGEPIHFKDQVLYYKSKSILEVIKLMLTKGGLDLFLVGSLVFLFSVLFPLLKLISTILFVVNDKLRKNKLVNFLVFKTGKWSMADVLVVAIFMAYLGFSGILTEQLEQLEHLSEKIEVLTTNKSQLQIGFYAFFSFTILGLFISTKLQSQLSKINTYEE